MISNHAPSATRSPLLALNQRKDGIDTPKGVPRQAEGHRHGRKATAQPKYAYFFAAGGARVGSLGYVTGMTSSDMNRLQTLYQEIESRLERGETSIPELAQLFAEISRLTDRQDGWFNLDPKVLSVLARHDASYKSYIA